MTRRNRALRARRILSNEAFYKDGPPHWREGKRKRPCQTAAQAEIEHARLVKRLRRFGKDNPAALDLAARLERCRPHRRCRSGACPECARAFQRWFVLATATFLVEQTGRLGKRTTILSPIHADGIVKPGSLKQ